MPLTRKAGQTDGAKTAPRTGVHVREIADADLDAVAALLTRGFAFRDREYWLRGLERHARRPRPKDYPAFGYCLDRDGVPVGVILLLFSEISDGRSRIIRANVSSWYVEPEFRAFSSLLVRAATRDKSVTYFNVTPAPHTWRQVEAQGFSVYCKGQIYAVPMLSRPVRQATVRPLAEETRAGLSDFEFDLLQQHAGFGCLSVVVRDGADAYPFVFQKHRVKNLVPVYRLLYCRDIGDLERFAGNVGRFLARRGGALLLRLDANGPSSHLTGWYSDKRGRKYAKGPNPPRLGDLAFSEAALFDG